VGAVRAERDGTNRIRFWPVAASALHMSAFEGEADMAFAFAVAIGGKADMGCCTAYVRF